MLKGRNARRMGNRGATVAVRRLVAEQLEDRVMLSAQNGARKKYPTRVGRRIERFVADQF